MAIATATRAATKKMSAAKKQQDNITKILNELQSQVNGLQEQQANQQRQLVSRPAKELNTNSVLSIMGKDETIRKFLLEPEPIQLYINVLLFPDEALEPSKDDNLLFLGLGFAI